MGLWVVVALAWYAVCCRIAYRLLVDAWRESFALTRGDRSFIIGMSALGPFSLLMAIFIWLMDHPWPGSDTVLLPKKDRSRV